MNNMKIMAMVVLLLATTCISASAASGTQTNSPFLDQASEFSVFAAQDITLSNTHVGGPLAGGGNVKTDQVFISKYIITKDSISLVSGKDLEMDGGRVYSGDLWYTGEARISSSTVLDGQIKQQPKIDFNRTFNTIKSQSSRLGALRANAQTAVRSWGETYITAPDFNFSVADISATDLAATNTLRLIAPAGSTVILNVSGEHVRINNIGSFFTPSYSKVLFNFYEAKTISLYGDLPGSILAPYADVEFINGTLQGGVIMNSLQGNGEVIGTIFTGYIPDEVLVNPEEEELSGDFLVLSGFNKYLPKFYISANFTEWINKSELVLSEYSVVTEVWN